MTRRIVILTILAAVMLSLLWSFYREAMLYDPLKGIEQTASRKEERSQAHGETRYAWGKEIVEKNLFSPLRGKLPLVPPAPKPEVEIPVIEIPDLKLNGIIVNQFGEYVVYIQKDREMLPPLRKGDIFGDLSVLDVREKSVDLLWDGQEVRLTMEKMRKH